MAEQNSIVYMYYIFIIYLFVDRRGCATISMVESILESKSHLILHCFSMFQLKIYVRPKNFLVETMFSLVSFFLIKKSFFFSYNIFWLWFPLPQLLSAFPPLHPPKSTLLISLLNVVCLPSEAPLENTIFFLWEHLSMDRASGLVMGAASTSLL